MIRLGPPPRHPPMDPHAPPREALRLMGLVLMGVSLPLLFRVHPWVALYCGGVFSWWSVCLWRGHATPHPRRTLLLLAAFVGMALVALAHGRLVGREAGIALLLAASFLKLMEIHTRRDGVLVVLLGFFLLLAEFFHGQQGWRVVHALAGTVALTTTLAGLNLTPHHGERFPWQAMLQTGGQLTLQALPLMLLLFFLFPRLAQPLWGLPNDAFEGRSKTGMSDHMTPGSIGELILSDEVAFRVRFDGPLPPPSERYWRGPVLWLFNGRQWRTWVEDPGISETVRPLAAPVEQEVVVEPHGQRWLFALDLPIHAPAGARLGSDFQLLSQQVVHTLMRYRVTSALKRQTGEPLPERLRQQGLQLPLQGNPRARELAARWRDEGLSPPVMVNRAWEMFRQEAFSYTLTPALLKHDEVDGFLFTTRQGFCEHYSGAFVFLMRAAGIPARVVLGYLGGEPNPITGELVVRQSHAHAWSEVWLPGQGWVRVDPTAAVAPDRVQRGTALRPYGGESLFSGEGLVWLRWTRQAWDALGSTWNGWVLGYDVLRQKELLLNFGFDEGSWQELAVGMVVVGGLFSLALAVALLWRGHHPTGAPIEEAYRRYCAHLARLGVTRPPWEGPMDYARRASAELPDRAGEIHRITRLYLALRYGERDDLGDMALLQRLVRVFRQRRGPYHS